MGNSAVKPVEKYIASMLLGLGMVLGLGTILAFWVFLYTGPYELFKLNLSGGSLLLFDAFLSSLFFFQHSCMIRKFFRDLLARICPGPYGGVIFSIFSGAALLCVILFWQTSEITLFSAQGAGRWVFRGAYFICIVGFAWCILALGSLDPFGLQAMLDHLKGVKRPPQAFIVSGPYRWVRHPVYFIWLVIFWAYPDLTADRVMLNVIWSAWILMAVHLEERDLTRSFGDDYRQYRNEVPMLIPRTIRPIR